MMNCTKCDGKGESHSDFACYNPVTTTFSPGMKPCHYCNGRGMFPVLDIAAIMSAIFTTRGSKRFRKSLTSPIGHKSAESARAYYVWRMARFHGGADVTMPVIAMMLIEGDPTVKALDAMSDRVAQAVYGTLIEGDPTVKALDAIVVALFHHAGGARWAWGALTFPRPHTRGGPVHDGNDPNTVALLAHESSE